MDKNKTQMEERIKQHDCIMKSNDKKRWTRSTSQRNIEKVLKHLKKKNQKKFKHINKAGEEYKDAMFDYMADFILVWYFRTMLNSTNLWANADKSKFVVIDPREVRLD